MELKHIPGFIWTPVRTKPRREKKLAEYCKANNVDCYLPLKRKLHRYDRRTVEFFIPMFPGYVFCCLDEDKYQRILRSNLIVFRIKIDEKAEDILLKELDAVMSFERISTEKEILIKPELVAGTRISVNAGPLKGVKGFVETRKGKTILGVNIELLGQSVSVELDAGDLDADDD